MKTDTDILHWLLRQLKENAERDQPMSALGCGNLVNQAEVFMNGVPRRTFVGTTHTYDGKAAYDEYVGFRRDEAQRHVVDNLISGFCAPSHYVTEADKFAALEQRVRDIEESLQSSTLPPREFTYQDSGRRGEDSHKCRHCGETYWDHLTQDIESDIDWDNDGRDIGEQCPCLMLLGDILNIGSAGAHGWNEWRPYSEHEHEWCGFYASDWYFFVDRQSRVRCTERYVPDPIERREKMAAEIYNAAFAPGRTQQEIAAASDFRRGYGARRSNAAPTKPHHTECPFPSGGYDCTCGAGSKPGAMGRIEALLERLVMAVEQRL